MEDFQDRDLTGLYDNYPQLNKPIIVPPRPLDEMNPELIMEAMENVLQSEENLKVTEGFEVQLGVARMEHGGANGHPIINVQEARFSKRSIVSIKNHDNLCLARAFAVGIAKNAMDDPSEAGKRQLLKDMRA